VTVSESVDPRALRAVCSHFVTGVTVITSGSGAIAAGTTVNSFTSVSLDPPLVLFCLHRQSRLGPVLAGCGMFVVNFLTAHQQRLAWAFAGRGNLAVQEVAQRHSAGGVPIIGESVAFLACRVANEVDGGDHVIVIGEVTELGIAGHGRDPLIFFRGAMGALEDGPPPTYPIIDG